MPAVEGRAASRAVIGPNVGLTATVGVALETVVSPTVGFPPWGGILMFRQAVGGLVAVLGALFTSHATAQTTTYSFTGAPYTSVTAVGGCTLSDCTPYTTTDRATVTLTFAAPLAPNLPAADRSAAIAAYTFSDGVRTTTGPSANAAILQAAIATDSAGKPVNYQITLLRTPGPPYLVSTPADTNSYIDVVRMSFTGSAGSHNFLCTSRGPGLSVVSGPGSCDNATLTAQSFQAESFVTPNVSVSTAGVPAGPVELIFNGGFDINVNGWTNANPGPCSYSQGTNAVPGVTGGYARPGALGPVTCGFYQDVTIPAGSTATLRASVGTEGNGTALSDAGRLQIRNPATNAVLATVYSHNGAVSAPDPVLSRGPFDLSPYAGQTIRIYLETQNGTTGYQHVLDNVSVLAVAAPAASVPTMTEWAMILFATILAGGAALYIQRRRIV